MRECVDYLQNPEVLIQEFMDAYTAVESCCDPADQRFRVREPRAEARAAQVAARSGVRQGTGLRLRRGARTSSSAWRATCSISGCIGAAPRVDGLDYVGQIIDEDPLAVLGVVQVGVESSPYALFLRLITCLSEFAPDAQLRAADEALFKGGLGAEPKLDLHLLLRETDRDAAQATLRQLTHDLAEVFYAGISEEWQFPDVLRNIVCLLPAPVAPRRS